jgi:hypothetical protein
LPIMDNPRVTGPDASAIWYAASNTLLVSSAGYMRPIRIRKLELQFLGSVLMGAGALAFTAVVLTRNLRDAVVAFVAVCVYALLVFAALLMGRRSARKTTPAAFQAEVALGRALSADSYLYEELDGKLMSLGFDCGLPEADERYPYGCAEIVEACIALCQEPLAVLADEQASIEDKDEARLVIKWYAEKAARLIADISEFADDSAAEEPEED